MVLCSQQFYAHLRDLQGGTQTQSQTATGLKRLLNAAVCLYLYIIHAKQQQA